MLTNEPLIEYTSAMDERHILEWQHVSFNENDRIQEWQRESFNEYTFVDERPCSRLATLDNAHVL